MKQSKNKDGIITVLFIFCAIFILIGIGATFAYFTSTTDFENEFNTALYQTTATEVFESPNNWLPGDTIPKELTITNTGNVNVKARVCISENWESANGGTLANTVNNESAAIINLDNIDDWTKHGNCYYYNDTLEPNDATSSFIESITFNPNVEADLICTPTSNNGVITKTCESTGDGYDNATYTLTLTVETVQANKADEIWVASETKYVTTGSTVYIGNEIPVGAYNTASEAMASYEGRPFYLKFTVEYGIVTESYTEFIITEEMANENGGMTSGTYALRGGVDESELESANQIIYLANKAVLQTAFGVSNCTDNTTYYDCSVSGLRAKAYSYGNVLVSSTGHQCGVDSGSFSSCDWD